MNQTCKAVSKENFRQFEILHKIHRGSLVTSALLFCLWEPGVKPLPHLKPILQVSIRPDFLCRIAPLIFYMSILLATSYVSPFFDRNNLRGLKIQLQYCDPAALFKPPQLDPILLGHCFKLETNPLNESTWAAGPYKLTHADIHSLLVAFHLSADQPFIRPWLCYLKV